MVLLSGGRIVVPDRVIDPGWITVDRGRIAEVGSGSPPESARRRARQHIDLDGDRVMPGFVDLHCHGGGGHPFPGGDPDVAAAGADFHLRHGTTTLLLGLVTAPMAALESEVGRLSALVAASRHADGTAGRIAGIHLEGPFLSEDACGAQNPAHMIDPAPDAVRSLLRAGGGTVRMVTIAPERDGALDAIGAIVEAGAIAAIGHTRATFDEAMAAIDAGATVATHLFNAMSGLHHREPGTVGAVLGDRRVVAELILDGHHVHPAAAAIARSAKGADGLALITDAIAAAGSAEPSVVLGGLDVRIVDGAARLVGDDTLAGSLLTMDRAVAAALAAGWPLVEVARMASTTPARSLGLAGSRGSIEVGKLADLVVLDPDDGIRRVLAAGEVIDRDRDGTPGPGASFSVGG